MLIIFVKQMMYSLEISINKFHSTANKTYCVAAQELITLRWGSIQSDIHLYTDPKYSNSQLAADQHLKSGNKKLIIDLNQQQMNQLIGKYVFGLFIQNSTGRYFSLLDLHSHIISNDITKPVQLHTSNLQFMDDNRQSNYQYTIALKIQGYTPRIPVRQAHAHISNNQNANNNRLQTNNQHLNKTNNASGQKISFLYGNMNAECKNITPYTKPKTGSKQNKIKPNIPSYNNNTNKYSQQQLQRTKNQTKKQHQRVIHTNQNKYQQNQQLAYEQDDDLYCPPVMQFTNQVQDNHYADIHQRLKNIPPVINVNTNADGGYSIGGETNMAITQPVFRQVYNNQHNKNISSQKIISKPSREQLREMARKQALQDNTYNRKGDVMIPILKGDSYELIPLSSLSKQQIVQYASKQKLAEQYRKQQQKAQKQRKARQIRQQEKRIKRGNFRKDKESVDKYQKQLKKQNMYNRAKLEINQQKNIIEQPQNQYQSSSLDSEQEYSYRKSDVRSLVRKQSSDRDQISKQDDQYQSDFDSISNAGSLLKSRNSLRSSVNRISQIRDRKPSQNQSLGISQSLDDYGYSQEFDSFSQSILGRNKRANSVSEISGSFTDSKR